jgi:hypothetical protein
VAFLAKNYYKSSITPTSTILAQKLSSSKAQKSKLNPKKSCLKNNSNSATCRAKIFSRKED